MKDRRPRSLPPASSPTGSSTPDPAPSPAPGPSVVRPAPATSTLAWARANPVLAVAVLAFLVLAVGGGFLFLPRAEKPRAPRAVTTAPPPTPRTSALDTPDPAASPAPAAEGEEVHASAVAPSVRGLLLTYSYRVLPPGGESRYGWTVWLAGPRPVRDGVELVTYEMDPPAKNGGQFESRDRAADGFPLFGHGPGGWFGVSATIRYRDGATETLARRIELPEPE